METLRQQWRDGDVTLGGWLSSASSTTAESMARTALDYVCVDMQHGTSDYASAVGQIQAIIAAGGTPIARVPWNEQGIIGKVLDAGALG
ncbi:MAG: aldolase, partial [Actinomycetia bacterium]|nr:aldolase [Actinomycetes bacterium]